MATTTEVRPQLRGRAATPPGWYDDPGGEHHLRYWDGAAWTQGVADGTVVLEAPLPAERTQSTTIDDRPVLPGRAFGAAVFGVVVGGLMSYSAARLALVAWPAHRAIALGVSSLGLWVGLLGACWIASMQWGSANPFRDLGMRFEAADSIRGFIAAFAARMATIPVLVILLIIDRRLIRSNVLSPQRLHDSTFGVLVVILLGIVGAPIVEELFFRGLLMRTLVPVLGGAGAIVGQAVLFGLAHINPVYGRGNVAIVLGVGVSGVIFGVLAYRSKRLGPSMFAHAFFNLTALLPLLLMR